MCQIVARWLANRVVRTNLRLLGLHRAAEDPTIATLVEDRPLMLTIHFVRSDGTILTGARALLAAGRSVPRWRALAILFDHRAGHLILEPLYRQVARRRRRIGRVLGAPVACPVPQAVTSRTAADDQVSAPSTTAPPPT